MRSAMWNISLLTNRAFDPGSRWRLVGRSPSGRRRSVIVSPVYRRTKGRRPHQWSASLNVSRRRSLGVVGNARQAEVAVARHGSELGVLVQDRDVAVPAG